MIVRRFFGTPRMKFTSPFEELDRMRQDLGRLLGEYAPAQMEMPTGVYPLTNITDDSLKHLRDHTQLRILLLRDSNKTHIVSKSVLC